MIFEYLSKLRDHGFFPSNVLDIGANKGIFSLQCRKIWPFTTEFHLVEADEDNQFNLLSAGFPIYNSLLGDKDGKIVTFYKTKDSIGCTGNSYYREKTKHYSEERVIKINKKMITLDTLFKDKGIVFDFAKLDTQGSELDILKGGKKTLSTCKYILIEVSLKYYNEGIPLKNDIINFMKDFSYNNYEVLEKHVWEQQESMGDIKLGDIFQEDIIFYK